jgi:hypothetical protein
MRSGSAPDLAGPGLVLGMWRMWCRAPHNCISTGGILGYKTRESSADWFPGERVAC